jgi:sensor histidine kinase regulating citrate/malate metabolism
VEGRFSAAKERVIIEISDSGMGIPESDQPHVFERFYQSSATEQKMRRVAVSDKKVTKVSALATQVGFDNSVYFSRQFLKRSGKRPVEFL